MVVAEGPSSINQPHAHSLRHAVGMPGLGACLRSHSASGQLLLRGLPCAAGWQVTAVQSRSAAAQVPNAKVFDDFGGQALGVWGRRLVYFTVRPRALRLCLWGFPNPVCA